jgi:hypothetical protein
MIIARQTRRRAGVVAAALLLAALPACEDDAVVVSSTGSGGSGGAAVVPGVDCGEYCAVMKANCTGDFAQYASDAICMSACAQLPAGTPDDTQGNTAGCRLHHARTATGSDGARAARCPPAGPGGADACGADCEGYCALMLGACTEFDTLSGCLAACADYVSKPPFSSHVTMGDNLQCRLYHASLAAADAALCAHAGAAPETGTCVDP